MRGSKGALRVTRACDKVNDCVVSLATEDDTKHMQAWHRVPLVGRWFRWLGLKVPTLNLAKGLYVVKMTSIQSTFGIATD